MNKIQFITLLVLIIYSYEICYKGDTTSSTKEECLKSELDEDEKELGYQYCCFMKDDFKYTDGACVPLTKPQYKNIKDFIKSHEMIDQPPPVNGIIECKSFYLKIGLLSLIFLLL